MSPQSGLILASSDGTVKTVSKEADSAPQVQATTMQAHDLVPPNGQQELPGFGPEARPAPAPVSASPPVSAIPAATFQTTAPSKSVASASATPLPSAPTSASDNAPGPARTTLASSGRGTTHNLSIPLGIGLGVGLPVLLAFVAARIFFWRRSRRFSPLLAGNSRHSDASVGSSQILEKGLASHATSTGSLESAEVQTDSHVCLLQETPRLTTVADPGLSRLQAPFDFGFEETP